MKIYIRKPLIIALVTLLCSTITMHLHSQTNQPADFSREKIFVHTDREFYLCGELVWFKLYCADARSGMPLSISKVAYVELINRSGEPVLQAKVTMNNEGGNGSFYLPLTLPSDEYILRAYTSWMKNAGSASFFEKRLSLVNTMRTARSAGSAGTASGDWEIVFFPEGGNMIVGAESKVGFKVTDASGRGLAVKGTVTDMDGNTVQSFSTHKFGLGHFTFRPEAGKTYRATITDASGKTGTSALPAVQPAGYILRTADNNDGRVKVTVTAKMKEGYRQDEQVIIAAHYGGQVKYSATHAVTSGNDLIIYLNKAQLGNGVNYFTLFDRDGKPLSERLYFNRTAIATNVTLAPDKPSYAAQDMVKLAITPGSTTADTVIASLSVYKTEPWMSLSPDNIVSYMGLTSALTGAIESPGYYFSNDKEVDQATDNLMLTHGWRRFTSKKESAASIYLPEYKGHFIIGRVINIKTGSRVAGADCFLSIPSAPFGFYIATSDSAGLVRFEVKDYYGPAEIFVQASVADAANYRVELLNPFSEEKTSTSLPVWAIDSTHAAALLEHSIAMQSSNIYTPDSIRRFGLPALIDTLPFFGNSEFDYPLDNYKRFTTMEEVLREYVTPINVTMRNGQLHMSMYNAITREVYQNNYIVMLDGVPLPEPDKIFSYDPLKVKRLRIVSRPYIFGPRVFSGLASFETYKGRFDGFDIAPSLVAIDYEGLQMQREFYVPARTGASARMPDMRTTLMWKPDLVISSGSQQNISFPASERKGNFIVVLQGLSKHGQPVYTTAAFEVK